ncbi:MAG: DJ-1/PfpI family protein [candidate division WOR-3 bacterium]|nr:MAG: DJ-1/PfpI family protein [candidate division WOR-3 bacterium]
MREGSMKIKNFAAVGLGVCMFLSCAPESKEGVRALVLAPRNLGANYYLLRDVIEEYGWDVTHTGVLDTITPCPWFAAHGEVFPLVPDLKVQDIEDISAYDCLIIAPSAGNAAPIEDANGDIIGSPEALRLIRRAAYYGLPVYATCAGVQILSAADVVRGRFIVGAPRFREEYIKAGANYVGRPRNDNPPTIDGNIITTARGQYYNYANVMAVATVIENSGGRGPKGSLVTGYLSTHRIDIGRDDVVWTKTYGGAGADGGRALCATRDNGYLVVGYTFAAGSSDADILVVKTDATGDLTWSRRFGGTGAEYGNACMEIDGGYLILGYTTSFGEGSKDLYLLRIDEEGNEVWSKTLGGDSWDVGTAMCRAGDSEYFVCGFTHSFGYGEEDIYLLKIDAQGSVIWSKTMGGWRIDMPYSIHGAKDGGCVIAASSGSISPNTDFYLLKVDSVGGRVWAKSFEATGEHGHGFDWLKGSSPAADGGWIMVGYSDCNDMMDVVVVKTDSAGGEQWLTSFGNKPFYEYGNGVCPTADGGYVVAGITKSMTSPTENDRRIYDNDIYVVKLDHDGNIVWERTIAEDGLGWANGICMTPDGDVAIVGHTESAVNGSLDALLMVLDGRSGSTEE